jgi:hypothetical protein
MDVEYGRKVFFLYPPSVVKDEMVDDLVRNEYEVYLLQDHRTAVKLFREYQNAVVFINIDYSLKDDESWEDYISALMNDERTSDVKIGIVSYESDKSVVEKFLMELMVPCGFVKLSLGLKESKRIIMKALDANEAKRRRKYVRVKCREPIKANFNLKKEGREHTGRILDISSYGMSIELDHNADGVLANKEYVRDIQLRLGGVICRASGFVVGRVEGAKVVHLIIFSKETAPNDVEKIHSFVHHCLQQAMDQKLKSLA